MATLKAAPTPDAKVPSKRGPMYASWHRQDPSTWNLPQSFFIRSKMLSQPEKLSPAQPKATDKVPHLPVWRQWAWLMPRALAPLLIHAAFVRYTGMTLHPVAAYVYYFLAYKVNAIFGMRLFNDLGDRYGHFDPSVIRDGLPDGTSYKVMWSLLGTLGLRSMLAMFCFYDRNESPLNLSWWLPVQIFVYSCVLDFWFYWYHRLMHEVPFLWQYHRTHHTTRHPNALLTAYADHEQEWMDMLGIPLLTHLVFPLNFPTWFVCQSFLMFTELLGHCGVRLYWQTPMTSYILQYFDMDLAIEDHDLHHRQGWKKAANYGKQTRIWDTLFGSTRDRVEGTPDNIDYVNTATLSL